MFYDVFLWSAIYIILEQACIQYVRYESSMHGTMKKSTQMSFDKSYNFFCFSLPTWRWTEFLTTFSKINCDRNHLTIINKLQNLKGANLSCYMVVIPHIFALRETDTYTWSQQGSPEICFCTGENRAFSQGICDLRTSPDRMGCPVPCLKGNAMKHTHTHTEWGVGTEKGL